MRELVPGRLLVVGQQGLDLRRILFVRFGPVVPVLGTVSILRVVVARTGVRIAIRFGELTNFGLLIVGQLQLFVDGEAGEGVNPMCLTADLVKPP
jgi:hypothetical protein